MAGISSTRDFTLVGGLMSYEPDVTEWARAAASIPGISSRATSPATLPVQQATSFILSINLKTAESLGITCPTGVLVRADEVIE